MDLFLVFNLLKDLLVKFKLAQRYFYCLRAGLFP